MVLKYPVGYPYILLKMDIYILEKKISLLIHSQNYWCLGFLNIPHLKNFIQAMAIFTLFPLGF